MATLVQNAIRIKNTLDDIKVAIIDKGQDPGDDILNYPNAIDNISTGFSPSGSPFSLVASTEMTSTTRTIKRTTYNLPISYVDNSYFETVDDTTVRCIKAGIYQIIIMGSGCSGSTTNLTSGTKVSSFVYKNGTQIYTYSITSSTNARGVVSFNIGQLPSLVTISANDTISAKVTASKSCYLDGKISVLYVGDM